MNLFRAVRGSFTKDTHAGKQAQAAVWGPGSSFAWLSDAPADAGPSLGAAFAACESRRAPAKPARKAGRRGEKPAYLG